MKVKVFGDTTPIPWEELGVKMPFAPMHELAKKYHLEEPLPPFQPLDFYHNDTSQVLEIPYIDPDRAQFLAERVMHRMRNTMAALDQATPDTICINLGGGYHHAGKYPNTGYAYSLINDLIWAVDYQLEQARSVGIIDLDFHFGGGTWEYYKDWKNPYIADLFHPKGILHNHRHLVKSHHGLTKLIVPEIPKFPLDKILLNIGTDWFDEDPLFGKYGNMCAVPLQEVWMQTIYQIVESKIPLAITFGGGYGDGGLQLYENLIAWIREL
jgi:acetoin utilization deacetylase AcuC-like enzyme